MKTSTLYLALSLAQLSICAPTPPKPQTISSHPPTTVPNTRPPHALPQTIHWGPDEDDDAFEISIDNRPITPTAGAEPSVVLQAPRPIITEYLMAISVKKDEERKKQVVDQLTSTGEGEVVMLQPHDDEELISVAEMEIIVPVIGQQRMRMPPCGRVYLSREHSDMIIICLAVVFLLVVVVLETFGSVPDRYRRVTGAGEIRLEDEKGTMTTVGGNSRTCLSIQADEV